MDGITIESVNNIVNSPSVYLTLFIMLLAYVLKSSQFREQQMRNQLDKIVPILDRLVRDVNDIKNELRKGYVNNYGKIFSSL